MTAALPRPIARDEIRAGDTVRVTLDVTATFTAEDMGELEDLARSGGDRLVPVSIDLLSYELLDRPSTAATDTQEHIVTTTLPRPIARDEIRAGDRIRVEWTEDLIETTEVATVASIDPAGTPRTAALAYIGPEFDGADGVAATYTLLGRPAPGPTLPTEPGSVILASRIDDVDYDPPVPLALAYTVRFHHHPWMLLGDRGDRDRWYRPERIKSWVPARIAPTDEPEAAREPRVGDPASMWEVSEDDERCDESSPILFCSRPVGHDGLHAARWDAKVQGVWS